VKLQDRADAAQALERDLVTAPYGGSHFRQLIGRLTVNTVMDHPRQSAEKPLAEAYCRRKRTFAPVWHSFRNRWPGGDQPR
jgi:Mg/Co/Ni transporter MgtE